jgi:hypothetical protein
VGSWPAKRRGKCACHQVGLDERCQIDESDVELRRRDQLLGHRERNRGLADSARSDDGHEALVGQVGGEFPHGVGASDHARHWNRQAWRALDAGRQGRQHLREYDWSHEAVASSGNRRQKAVAAATIAQRPAQARDMHLEIALLDEGAGPDTGHELVLADQLAGALEQSDQNLQRATAEPHGLVSRHQEPSRRQKSEVPERDHELGRGRAPIGCPEQAIERPIGVTLGPSQMMLSCRSGGDRNPFPSL